jgi:type IV pilus assembly protein PilQ
MIAQQTARNLVISGDVSGEISLRLRDVNLETALDALLTANGFTYFLRGDVIVVKSLDETDVGDLVSNIITLKYIDPITVQKALEPRLSNNGRVVILDKTAPDQVLPSAYVPNRVMIVDRPQLVEKLTALARSLDVRERSVLIEARIIETTIDSESRLGFNWPSSVQARLTGVDDGTSTSSSSSSSTTSNRNAAVRDLENGT